ncbi:MAG: phenylalanine--tRNA ligase subunit alpha [Alphaproteobacteria bacterium]
MDAWLSTQMALIAETADIPLLEALRLSLLGKKGQLTAWLKSLGWLSVDQRKIAGGALNQAKIAIEEALAQRFVLLEQEALNIKLAKEKVDVTLPIRPAFSGSIHPISQTIDEIISLFAADGFGVAEGTDIEDDYFNFTALNMPEDHPARQMHDTFYLPDGENGKKRLLRTHTSPVQIHTMKKYAPPIRVIVPGRTYRSDYDMTHTPMFHQVEGLVIGENIHMGHLKGCIENFLRNFFGVANLALRFRPSFFPFTEPSAEVDIACNRQGGKLVIGEGNDWLEVMGCGMVHPKVLEHGGVDATKWQGFAFGMGVERLAMLKYGIPDLRTFFEGDVRWLAHYGFAGVSLPNAAFKS